MVGSNFTGFETLEEVMAMTDNMPSRAVETDEPMGRLSWQKTATERRSLPAGRPVAVLEKAIRFCCPRDLHAKSTATRLQVMRRTYAIVVTFLVMLGATSPALACLLPGRPMTVAEHVCCKKMAEMCGSSRMPGSHSCCQKESQSGNTSILIAHHQSAPAVRVIMVLSTASSSREFELLEAILDRPPSDSPPNSSVLRI